MIYTVTLNPCIDITIECNNLRINSLNRTTEIRSDIGGKGINVSKTISALKGQSTALGFIAGDSGDAIQDYLSENCINHHFIGLSRGETRSNYKVIDTKNNTQTELNGTGPYVTQPELEQLLEYLVVQTTKEDIIVISGSAPPGLDTNVYQYILKRLADQSACVILDVPGEYLAQSYQANPFLIKPNINELSQVMGEKIQSIESVIQGAKVLVKKGIQNVMVSMGAEGSIFVNHENQLYLPPIKVDVHSCIGAGDAMVAGLAYAFERNLPLLEVLALAHACGTAAVMTKGTQAVHLEDVQKLIEKVVIKPLPNPSSKEKTV